jgi:hypothetical protein
MCDGVWARSPKGKFRTSSSKQSPEEACKELVNLAERRGADDNLSVQVVQIEAIERLSYYRGLPTYQKESPGHHGKRIGSRSGLDGDSRSPISSAKSGMASIFKAIDLKTNGVVALKVPFMQFESDPGFFSASSASRRSARR